MTNFDSNTKVFGLVKQGTVVEAEYRVITSRNVVSVTPACGCLSVSISNKKVILRYKTGTVPAHLGNFQEDSKFAVVRFSDGTVEKVYLKVTITRL